MKARGGRDSAWLSERSGDPVAPPRLACPPDQGYPAIVDAPGVYVREA